MSGYSTRLIDLQVCGQPYQLRALSDNQQFSDPDGLAADAGISSALWSLFGQVWPASEVLATAMSAYAVDGKRILELGCGLALSSLVLQRRAADVLASDHHPLALTFLRDNAELNGLTVPSYVNLPWEASPPSLGQFELIIGSDVLYQRDHAALLAGLIQRHAAPHAEIVVTDPGRGHGNSLGRLLRDQGFEGDETRLAFGTEDKAPFRGRLLRFRR